MVPDVASPLAKHLWQPAIRWQLLLLALLWGGELWAQTVFRFETYGGEKIRVSFRDSLYETVLDTLGTAYIQVPDSQLADYATVYGPRSLHTFYLLPGTRQEVYKPLNVAVRFGGAGKVINDYLNSGYFQSRKPDYGKSGAAFVEDWKTYRAELYAHLDSMSLPENFVRMERKRLYYLACGMLLAYPSRHTSSVALDTAYYRLLEEVMKEDAEAVGLAEYLHAFKLWVQLPAEGEPDAVEPTERLRGTMHRIRQRVADHRLADYLVHTCLCEHIRYNGAEGIDEFVGLHREAVAHPARQAQFARLYQQYTRLAKGRPAPDFRLTDIDGRQVTLSDFAGSYVYIDVWATWCIPCCRELPFFHQLEEKFKDSPIRFVSISIDTDESAWRKKVAAERLTGILLHADRHSTFGSDYQVRYVPRFLLIDPEGKIVDANMSRPSDPQTLERLENCK